MIKAEQIVGLIGVGLKGEQVTNMIKAVDPEAKPKELIAEAKKLKEAEPKEVKTRHFIDMNTVPDDLEGVVELEATESSKRGVMLEPILPIYTSIMLAGKQVNVELRNLRELFKKDPETPFSENSNYTVGTVLMVAEASLGN